MSLKPVLLSLIVLMMFSCKQSPKQLTKIEGTFIKISDSLQADSSIEQMIVPYRTRINKDLDSVLCYAKDTYSKKDGHLNTAIGNFLADMIYDQTNPVFNTRTGKNIDMVLLNHGGIRAIISKGDMTARTAYEVMPFENSVVVVQLKGKQVKEAISYLSQAKRAHPISKLKLTIDKNFNATKALIKGQPIKDEATYYIATNDYLYNGGDRMTFFKPNDGVYNLDYKIRNAFIDYMNKMDTINPAIDDRFIQTN